MQLNHAFDPVLAPLAEPFCRQADTLLDLRACASSKTRPGRCVACYFALQTAAAARVIAKLCPLRNWLETHIEVVASDESSRPLEAFPLQLSESEDLETYCRRTMAEFHENRAYGSTGINLAFRYKQAA
ncbi:hypothetical protein [Rariglobus hedericola]|uniref:Uncharacterized protein n=1 Tax=Rariglobus hedericola TaxID=2597822 RepID=A0A556QKI0_9BACT|nr:hypothetical protein [Rariglobus hedericola]TSJ77150.1 hypothetical protein FPL22_13690 [Rariglobus hedericola]